MSDPVIYGAVIVVYMAILVFIGLFASRRLRNSSDFYIGGRKIGPWVTAMSFLAAYFSSVVIVGGGGFGYKFGLSTLWVGAINVLLGCMLAWMVLGRRIRDFTHRLDSMTIPGFLEKRFRAPEAKVFSAIVIAIFMVVYNVSVLQGMGRIFEVLMNIPYIWAAVISGIIIVAYVAIGGYLAVVWTSFVQAWIMFFGLILLTVFALNAAGGMSNAANALAAIDPGYVNTPGIWGWAGLISYCLIVSFGVWGMPQLVIRFYSIKKSSLLKLGTVIATVGGCMAVLPYLNGALARVLYPGLTNPDLAIPTLVKGVLPSVGAAIFLAAVVAAGMSTFASVLIIVSSAIQRNIFRQKKGISEREKVWRGKITSAIVGLLSLLLALRPPALVLVLCAFAWAVIASTCLWPMLFGIYWKRATRAGVFASMIGGFVVSLGWMVAKKPFGIHGFIPGLIVALILIVVVSLFTRPPEKRHIDYVWGEAES